MALTQYDLDNGSSISCDIHTDWNGELVSIKVDRRDAANIALKLRGGKLGRDDREALAKIAELIEEVLA